jgi:AcrR family transcriptional regulator
MSDPHTLDTRHRLLDAAGEVFAECGYRRATVREICRRAQANIAAVNYHFRDKDGLYVAVVREAHRAAHEKYPAMLDLGPRATVVERLEAFVRSFLLRLFDPGRPAWHGLLLAREMVEPTRALDELVEESIRPRYELLLGIVRELLGPEQPEDQVWLCANSIIGQCMHYHHARHVLARLSRQPPRDTRSVERLAEHIVQFSLGAMQHLSNPLRTTAS